MRVKDLRESQRKQQAALEKLRSIKEDKRRELIRRKEQEEERRRREEERKKQEEERRRREEEEAQRYFAVAWCQVSEFLSPRFHFYSNVKKSPDVRFGKTNKNQCCLPPHQAHQDGKRASVAGEAEEG